MNMKGGIHLIIHHEMVIDMRKEEETFHLKVQGITTEIEENMINIDNLIIGKGDRDESVALLMMWRME